MKFLQKLKHEKPLHIYLLAPFVPICMLLVSCANEAKEYINS